MTILPRFYYTKVFRGDELKECSVFKKLKLAAAEMLRRKQVGERVTRYIATQQAPIASLERTAQYYKGVAGRGDNMDKASSSGSGGGGNSLQSRTVSVAERNTECGCSVPQIKKKGSVLYMHGSAARSG